MKMSQIFKKLLKTKWSELNPNEMASVHFKRVQV